jgi:hypothetical protein
LALANVHKPGEIRNDIRSPIFALENSVNAVGGVQLLPQGRDVVVPQDGSVQSVLAFPRREGGMGAINVWEIVLRSARKIEGKLKTFNLRATFVFDHNAVKSERAAQAH